MITEFTPLLSLTGGILIGLSAVMLMAFNGRIAGMTGVVSGVLPPFANDWDWRAVFLIGAIGAPALLAVTGYHLAFSVPISNVALTIGGLIVGVGVAFSSGCTSGHGVCGMARLSPRSLTATLTFMIVTFATVYVVRHVIGG